MALLGVGVTALPAYEFFVERPRQRVIEERSKRLPTNLRLSIPDHTVACGFSPDNNSTANGLALATDLGTFPQYLNYYLKDLSQVEIIDEMKSAAKNGIVPIVSTGFPYGLKENYSGFCKFLRGLLPKLESFGCPYILRPFFEINGPWTKDWWGNMSPKDFTTGWPKMYKFIHDNSRNALVAFCLNSSIYLDPLDPHPFDQWFPGREYMDIFAIDIYNRDFQFGVPYYPKEIIIGPDIVEMNALAPKMPKAVTEIGSFADETWAPEAAQYVAKLGVGMWAGFAWNKRGLGLNETNWNPEDHPTEMHEFQKELSKPYYIATNKSLRGNPKETISRLLNSPIQ